MSTTFEYKDYKIEDDGLTVTFRFTTQSPDGESFHFTEGISFPEPLHHSMELEKLLAMLHLALGISYYKTFLPPIINHPYYMEEQESRFWNTVLQQGLGEFLLTNNKDVSVLATFKSQDGVRPLGQHYHKTLRENALLGIGGGKDSIVAGELLKKAGIVVTGFVLSTGDNVGQSAAVAQVMAVPLLQIRRRIDPKIFELNKHPQALNGHIPISLIFALAGAITALNRGEAYIVVGNEASASIPQRGMVNHQWSKSLEFEKLFSELVRSVIDPSLQYFSAIRSLSSVGVAKLFSKLPQYFEVFTSDNAVFKQERTDQLRWHENSAKTLSSFVLLSPWLNEEELVRIFGFNIFDHAENKDMLWRLLGLAGDPPLDCVGTPAELRISASAAFSTGKFAGKPLAKELGDMLELTIEDPMPQLFSMAGTLGEHCIPSEIATDILSAIGGKS